MLRRVLLGLIAIGIVVAVVGWLVRFQPFGPAGPMGSPLPASHATQTGWRPGPDAPFSRLEMATAAQDGRIWLAGGLEPDGSATDAVSILDPEQGTWTDGPPLPAPLHHAALVSDGEQLFLIGGYLGSTGEPVDEVWVLGPDAESWEPGPPLPERRGAGAAAYDGARIVYGGGVGPGGVRADVFVLQEGEWTRIGAFARPREHLAAATDGAGAVWFMGGRQGGLNRNVGDVEVVQGPTIAAVSMITPRGGVAAFYAPDVGACLTGGETPPFALPTVECVDAAGRVVALPDMRQRRHGHGIAVIEGLAYAVMGGEVPGLSASSTTEVLALGS
jgi:Kelch motif